MRINNSNVTFYITKSLSLFDCMDSLTLVIKDYFITNKSIYIHSDNIEIQNHIDNYLWSFDRVSFIPHIVIKPTDKFNYNGIKVIIGNYNNFPIKSDILFNLSNDTIINDSSIIEFVNEENKDLSRKKYKYYIENKYIVKHQKI